MDDLKTNQALEAALLHLKQSHELALTDGGRYQGLYRLMAHPSPQIRAMVGRPFVSPDHSCSIPIVTGVVANESPHAFSHHSVNSLTHI